MTGYEFWFGYWWIFPLAMIFFCMLFARRMRGGGGMWGCCSPRNFQESPLDILNKRYAKGEIDQEEYEEKKKTIEEDLKK